MDNYETTYEKLNEVDRKREVDLDDFEEFMRKVEEVNKMVHALTSNNKTEIEEASHNADVWLKNQNKEKRKSKELCEEIIHEPSANSKRIIDKTIINEKAFKEEKKEKKEEDGWDNLNCETMSQEMFMRTVEADAKKRSEDRKQRKIESDAIKEKAMKAFQLKDYEKALDLYNKAIDVRKDSCVLYISRALTLLNLGLNSRALADSETALRLDEKNFKATMYKGKALFLMAEEEKAEEWMNEAKKIFPDKVKDIEEYIKSWTEEEEEEEECNDT